MEKLAYLVIGASVAIVIMTFLPMSHPTMSSEMVVIDTGAGMDMADMSGMGAAHQHPPREVSSDLPQPSVTHLVFPDIMGGYNVQILTQNFEFTPAAINRPPQDNEGHAHIYVNGTKIARVYSNWFHLPAEVLSPGKNDVTVTLNANDHSGWAINGILVSSTVRVTVPHAIR